MILGDFPQLSTLEILGLHGYHWQPSINHLYLGPVSQATIEIPVPERYTVKAVLSLQEDSGVTGQNIKCLDLPPKSLML